MSHHRVTRSLRHALLDASALKALAEDQSEFAPTPAAETASRLIRRLQSHLDNAQWAQGVDPADYVGHCQAPIVPIDGISADSYHALAFGISDKILQDVSYILSCAAKDAARKGNVVHVYDENGAISAELLERHWIYIREYLVSHRCPDFALRADEILACMEHESACGAEKSRPTG